MRKMKGNRNADDEQYYVRNRISPMAHKCTLRRTIRDAKAVKHEPKIDGENLEKRHENITQSQDNLDNPLIASSYCKTQETEKSTNSNRNHSPYLYFRFRWTKGTKDIRETEQNCSYSADIQ